MTLPWLHSRRGVHRRTLLGVGVAGRRSGAVATDRAWDGWCWGFTVLRSWSSNCGWSSS